MSRYELNKKAIELKAAWKANWMTTEEYLAAYGELRAAWDKTVK